MSSVIFLSCSLYKLQNPSVQGSIIIPAFFLSRKKLRPRDVKWLDQGHKAQPDSGPGKSRPFQFPPFLPGPRVCETRARSTTYTPVAGREPGWTLEHLGSRLKSAKNLQCDLGQATCLKAQPRSLKLCFQCARALFSLAAWLGSRNSLCSCSEQLHLAVCSSTCWALWISSAGSSEGLGVTGCLTEVTPWVKVGWR